jgi:hypothetical protein
MHPALQPGEFGGILVVAANKERCRPEHQDGCRRGVPVRLRASHHSGSLNMRRHRGSAVDSHVGACPYRPTGSHFAGTCARVALGWVHGPSDRGAHHPVRLIEPNPKGSPGSRWTAHPRSNGHHPAHELVAGSLRRDGIATSPAICSNSWGVHDGCDPDLDRAGRFAGLDNHDAQCRASG